MTLYVYLANCGNPDFGQNPDKPIPGVQSNVWVEVDDLTQAGSYCRDYIEGYDLGSGNWIGGFVADDDKQVVAYVSYNGRVWDMGHEYVPQHLIPEGYSATPAPKP